MVPREVGRVELSTEIRMPPYPKSYAAGGVDDGDANNDGACRQRKMESYNEAPPLAGG